LRYPCPQKTFEMSKSQWPKIGQTVLYRHRTERRRLHAAALPSMGAAPSRAFRRSKRRPEMLARILGFGRRPRAEAAESRPFMKTKSGTDGCRPKNNRECPLFLFLNYPFPFSQLASLPRKRGEYRRPPHVALAMTCCRWRYAGALAAGSFLCLKVAAPATLQGPSPKKLSRCQRTTWPKIGHTVMRSR
jgi:hypothetical protein